MLAGDVSHSMNISETFSPEQVGVRTKSRGTKSRRTKLPAKKSRGMKSQHQSCKVGQNPGRNFQSCKVGQNPGRNFFGDRNKYQIFFNNYEIHPCVIYKIDDKNKF